MRKMITDKARKGHALVTALGITAVALVMLVSTASAEAIAGGGPFAYITNSASNNVSVIDTVTNNVTATVDVGSLPFGVAASPDGIKVYVANYLSNNVSVIDTATNTVTDTVNVGSLPFGIAVNPQGTRVYVANYLNNTVSVICTAADTVIATVDVGRGPWEVAVSPDGKKVYVTNFNNNNISVIDTATNTVITSINVGSLPFGVAVNPDGKKVYVTNADSNTVSVIDTAMSTVIATVNVGIGPWGVAVCPDGSKVYVANSDSNNVSVIDTTTNTVTATVNVGNLPCGIAVNPQGTKVYVANSNSNNVSVIDTATNTITATVNVGRLPVAFGQFIGPILVLPVANFSANVTSGYVPLTVQFNDSSKNISGWNWDFGDGFNSTEQNPMHNYSAAGNYIVNLTVSNVNGTDSKLATIDVQKSTPLITWSKPADIIYGTSLNSTQLNASGSVPGTFVYTPNNGNLLSTGTQTLHVDFTPNDTVNYSTASKNVSINVLKSTPTITWSKPADMTYGTPLCSAQLNASASVPGNFAYDPAAGTVLNEGIQTLRVVFTPTDATNCTTASKNVSINVLPVAAFSASPTSGAVPLTVLFTDKSAGSPNSWSWNFGDKSTSINENPIHTYSKAGTYTVNLTVKNAAGSNTKTISKYISVSRK
jgi:YVTN family beta-propeller protein